MSKVARGGGASVDKAGGFPLHAHLCCLPVTVDLHATLVRECVRKPVASPYELASVAPKIPYVYVESMNEKSAYVASSREGRFELEQKRLKPTIATLMGFPERGYWRTYPGDRELALLIERWRSVWRS